MKSSLLIALLSGALILSACSEKRTSPAQREVLLTLAPSPDNLRNSEGDFITLNDGTLLFVYTHYDGSGSGDHNTAWLAARRSLDSGSTWSAEDETILENDAQMNIMSVSLLRLKNGKIALFYLKKNSETDCIPMMRTSSDEAQTWSEPIACISDKTGYFVLNNDRAIQLRDGRLILPVALHRTIDGQWQQKATLYSYYSDDQGQSWHSSRAVPDTTEIITQEPGVVELNDGQVMMYIRASGRTQQLSYSEDRGATWSHIAPGSWQSPLAPTSIKRIPTTGDLLAVWNNNDPLTASDPENRTPLTVAISRDEGESWSHHQNIETDPDGWYCYTAIHFIGQDILLGYCAGSQSEQTHLSVTTINRLPITSL